MIWFTSDWHLGHQGILLHQRVGRKAMDVGIDNIHRLFGEWRPISLHEILTILGGR